MRRINEFRIDAGYTISDIAHLMEVDEATACSWLSGTLEPDEGQQARLAAILQVKVHDLDDLEADSSRFRRLRERLAAAGIRVPSF